MTALSFQTRFAQPIREGTKRQTIRAKRRDGRPPAKPGDKLQLYCHQRRRDGFLIGEALCTEVQQIEIRFQLSIPEGVRMPNSIHIEGRNLIIVQSDDHADRLDEFARLDGFKDWAEMRDFWKKHHPSISHFEGWIIYWEPIK